MKQGVCCECQLPAPIEVRPSGAIAIEMGLDLDLGDELAEYVVAEHEAFGRWCNGQGTAPQAIVS